MSDKFRRLFEEPGRNGKTLVGPENPIYPRGWFSYGSFGCQIAAAKYANWAAGIVEQMADDESKYLQSQEDIAANEAGSFVYNDHYVVQLSRIIYKCRALNNYLLDDGQFALATFMSSVVMQAIVNGTFAESDKEEIDSAGFLSGYRLVALSAPNLLGTSFIHAGTFERNTRTINTAQDQLDKIALKRVEAESQDCPLSKEDKQQLVEAKLECFKKNALEDYLEPTCIEKIIASGISLVGSGRH